jgi:hypothetical protein
VVDEKRAQVFLIIAGVTSAIISAAAMNRISDPRLSLTPNLDRTVDPAVTEGIRQASRATNVDFGFLLTQAGQESGYRSDAKSATSSASGLFQFVESTWLDMVRRHGAQHGIGDLARSVAVDDSGRPSVADPATRRRILDLRNDPKLSAAFAAEYARSNKQELERSLGRKVGNTDLYLAHFLGPAGATQFLRGIARDSLTPAADLLPEAAGANRAVFYRPDGKARTVAEIYRSFAAKFEKEASLPPAASGTAMPNVAMPDIAMLDTATPAGASAAAGVRSLLGVMKLSEPVAAMFDVVALAALRLVNGTVRPAPERAAAALDERRDAKPV